MNGAPLLSNHFARIWQHYQLNPQPFLSANFHPMNMHRSIAMSTDNITPQTGIDIRQTVAKWGFCCIYHTNLYFLFKLRYYLILESLITLDDRFKPFWSKCNENICVSSILWFWSYRCDYTYLLTTITF